MTQVTIGGNVICEMDAVAQAEYEKVARWLQEAITERDAARASARLSETVASERLGEMYRLVDQRNAARADVALLKTSVELLQGTVEALQAQRDFLVRTADSARCQVCQSPHMLGYICESCYEDQCA